MDEKEIRKVVVEIIRDQLGVDAETVTDDSKFVGDLGADSLDTMELVMEFEDEFEIDISDDDAEKINAVGQAINCIKKKLAEKEAAK